MTSTSQRLSHERTLKFIALYEAGVSSEGIAEEMGWTTNYPKQMIQNYVKRYRARGYEIGAKGSKK